MSDLPFWYVNFMIEPSGREVELHVQASSSKDAIMAALSQLELADDELLHTLHAHIGVPVHG